MAYEMSGGTKIQEARDETVADGIKAKNHTSECANETC